MFSFSFNFQSSSCEFAEVIEEAVLDGDEFMDEIRRFGEYLLNY